MVKKLSGYILIGVGLLGFTFFESYKGNTIPLPTLWLILSIGIAVIGIYLTIIAKTKKQIQKLNETTSKLNRIKDKGERIFIDLDNCDFKAGTTTQLSTESFSRIQMIDALYDPNRNHKENNSSITYIIYRHKNGDTCEKFVSQPFSIDDTMLKYYVSQNKIALYVDRFDRTQYFFDFE